jgi:hypothetical protein
VSEYHRRQSVDGSDSAYTTAAITHLDAPRRGLRRSAQVHSRRVGLGLMLSL